MSLPVMFLSYMYRDSINSPQLLKFRHFTKMNFKEVFKRIQEKFSHLGEYMNIFIYYRQKKLVNWGFGQCFAPQMGSSVCEHQCGSWQGLSQGDGQIAMAHAPIQIIPGPMQQWRTCWGPGWHSLYPDTGRFLVRASINTGPKGIKSGCLLFNLFSKGGSNKCFFALIFRFISINELKKYTKGQGVHYRKSLNIKGV